MEGLWPVVPEEWKTEWTQLCTTYRPNDLRSREVNPQSSMLSRSSYRITYKAVHWLAKWSEPSSGTRLEVVVRLLRLTLNGDKAYRITALSRSTLWPLRLTPQGIRLVSRRGERVEDETDENRIRQHCARVCYNGEAWTSFMAQLWIEGCSLGCSLASFDDSLSTYRS